MSPRSPRHRVVPVTVLVTTLALAGLSPSVTAPATAAPVTDPPQTPARQTTSKTFTLVTGDVVRLTGDQVQVVADAPPIGDVVVSRIDADVYAVPTVASGLLARNRLDPKLFDLSELARSGYDDASRPELPLLATGPAVRGRQHTAARTTDLPAARAAALGMDRSRRGAFFAGITRAGGRDLQPGITKLWLDGKVRASADSEPNTLIGAPKVWQDGYDGTGQTIAVLDTGVDDGHPDLAGKLVASKSFVPGDDDPLTDENGHGTHVSSIALGSGSASGGLYAGSAKGAKLVIGKVLDDTGSGQWSWVIEGMAWAARQAKTVSMSLGGAPTDGTDPVSAALDEISAQTGSLFVVAAGNWGPGYGNPYPFTVAAPAAASRALAVGNGYHGFWLDPSSSAGPGLGDLSLKPEIVAPGTEIVAARSADSRLGPLPDAPAYTSLTGTSMATPRVSGAVAVLRQQHPDWTAAQLEDAITSTSCTDPCRGATGGPGSPASPQIYWRGAGGLDLQRASEQAAHGTGIVDFGLYSGAAADRTVTKTVTYTNDADTDLALTLTTSFQRPDANYGYNFTAHQPPAGAFTVEPGTVTVPAHGSRQVQLTVDLTKLPETSVYGDVVATAGDTRIRTTFGWTKTAELHKLNLSFFNPRGEQPDDDPTYGVLTDLENGSQRAVYYYQGHGWVADFAGVITDQPKLPAHRYSLTTFQGQAGESPWNNFITSWTVGGVPDLVMDRDRAITVDARTRRPIRLGTDRPSVPGPRGIEVSRTVTAADGTSITGGMMAKLDVPGADLYALPGAAPVTGTQRTRVLEFREAPAVTVTVDHDAVEGRRPATADLFGAAFPARGTMNLYDGGDGSAAALAGAAGKLVLVDERIKTTGKLLINDVVTAALEAGAAGVLVAVRDNGPAARNLSMASPVGVAVVTKAQADQLRAALTRGRDRVSVAGGYPSSYTYDLVQHLDGAVGAATTVRVRDRDLATRRISYGTITGSPGYQISGDIRGDFFGLFWGRRSVATAGTVRDELATPGYRFGLTVQQAGVYSRWWNAIPVLTAGRTVPITVGGALAGGVSGYAATNGQQAWLDLSGSTFASTDDSASLNLLYDGHPTTAFKVSRDGQQVCSGPYAQRCDLTAPGRHVIELDTTQDVLPLGTASNQAWTVDVPAPKSQAPEPLPMITWNWSSGSGASDTVPDRPYPVTLRPAYRPAYPVFGGPVPYPLTHGAFRVTLQVTYDDGATWRTAGTAVIQPGHTGEIVVRPPAASNGYVGYRITGADQAGNALDQRVLRVARTP